MIIGAAHLQAEEALCASLAGWSQIQKQLGIMSLGAP